MLVRKPVQVELLFGVHRNPDTTWNFWADEAARIAYVRIETFAEESATQLADLLQQLRRDGMTGMILDLRFNLGGALKPAIAVADVFLDQGTIVTVVRRGQPEQNYSAERLGSYSRLPLAVLVNEQSASGSELLAAALADHGRAVLIGERTFGKGSIQTLIPLPQTGGALKLTTATFRRPNGGNLHRFGSGGDKEQWGVLPTDGFALPEYHETRQAIREALRNRRVIFPPGSAPPPAVEDTALLRAIAYLRDVATNSSTAKP